MGDKRLMWTRDDGMLMIETVAEGIPYEQYAALFIPQGKTFEVVDVADLPARDYRNAWKALPGKKIGHDMVKARELHRNKFRELREPKLKELDTEYMRADEDGDQQKKKEIAAKKKALRDVTADPAIEAAQTIEQLRLVMPAILT